MNLEATNVTVTLTTKFLFWSCYIIWLDAKRHESQSDRKELWP